MSTDSKINKAITMQKYYCKDCGKKITYNSALYGMGRCIKCSNQGKNIGRKLSKTHKKKLSKLSLGRKHSKSTKAKMRKAKIGRLNPMFGKHHTLKQKKQVSEKMSGEHHPLFGKYHSIETKKKQSKARKGKYKGKDSPRFGKIASHGKGSFYKKIYMRSSYEIKFAQFLDLSGIKYLYEPKAFDLGNTTYRPDFYILEFDCYIEIKGWWRYSAKIKFNKFKKKYSKIKIKVLMKSELGVL